MEIGKISSTGIDTKNPQSQLQPAERIERQRKESNIAAGEDAKALDKVNPEEILQKIKDISENGKYSIRFEKHEELEEFVVKVVDQESEKVIRQIPPEEILGFKIYMHELRGNVVNMFR